MMRMEIRLLLFVVTLLATSIVTSEGKKDNNLGPCPVDDKTGCIECTCDSATGYKKCIPTKCPGLIKKASEVKKKEQTGRCPYGKKFKAECSQCKCKGKVDRCAVCFALPVSKYNQPADVNKLLPRIQDNRFFGYEVNGWKAG